MSFGGSHPQACSPKRSVATFGSRSRSSRSSAGPLGLCFRVTNPRLRSPEGAISHLLRCFIGSPRACAPPWLAFTFGSEGEAFAPRCLSWRWAPFGRSCRPTPEPCRQVRRCFWGWNYHPSAFPKVQSPTLRTIIVNIKQNFLVSCILVMLCNRQMVLHWQNWSRHMNLWSKFKFVRQDKKDHWRRWSKFTHMT